jgi:hypothetical protein
MKTPMRDRGISGSSEPAVNVETERFSERTERERRMP